MIHWHIVIRNDPERRLGALCTTAEAAVAEKHLERILGYDADAVVCYKDCFGRSK
jgi:hypothetical protein